MSIQVAIVGVGLIGGSLGLCLRQAGFASRIVGCGRSRDNLEVAQSKGCIDAWTNEPAAAVVDADLVFVSVPVATTRAVFRQIAPALKSAAIVTDAGSVKASVLAAVDELPEPQRFVGGHPIAGTENSGAAAADANLFRGRRWVLTPTEATAAEARATVERMIAATGAYVDVMSAARHDEIFAWVSHLPHAIAFALADAIRQEDESLYNYGGGGIREFLRIAASDPTMWRDIFAANAPALQQVAQRFAASFQALAAAADDPKTMEALLRQIQQSVRASRKP